MNNAKYKVVYRVYVNNILYDVYYNDIVAITNITNLKKKFKNVKVDSSNNKPITKVEQEIIKKSLIL